MKEKLKGSLLAKLLVFILLGAFSVAFVWSMIIGEQVIRIAGSVEQASYTGNYYETTAAKKHILEQLNCLINGARDEAIFTHNGKLDMNATIDILEIDKGIDYKNKDDIYTYTLETLSRMDEEDCTNDPEYEAVTRVKNYLKYRNLKDGEPFLDVYYKDENNTILETSKDLDLIYSAKQVDGNLEYESGLYGEYSNSIRKMMAKNSEIRVSVDIAKNPEMEKEKTFYETYQEDFYKICAIAIISAIGMCTCIVFSIIQAGNRIGEKKVNYLTENIPIEVKIGIDIMLLGLVSSVCIYSLEKWYWILIIGSIVGVILLSDLILVTFVGKCKARVLTKNSICKWIWKQLKRFGRFVRMSPELWIRVGGLLIAFITIQWILVAISGGILLFPFYAAVLYLLMKEAKQRQFVRNSLMKIAKGDLDYEVDTQNLSYENLEMAQALNHLNDGLKKAVDEKIKSERLRTDLITNVSHDIKTPLTSIINYVDLLKREQIEDEKIAGYIDVLEQKSARLKQLTEDLVEASKVSSGNVEINMMEIDLVEFLQQVNGEFAEKFDSRNLQMVCDFPTPPVTIHADGRHLFRVFENLYNNVFKYAMPNTRVYIRVDVGEKKTLFTMKNISESPLNCDAEELMERFVRGDVARTTQGSGLGLEIAKNLMKLQGGTLKLHLDGDLFKVSILFDA